MVIFDREKQTLNEYSSDPDFDQGVVSHMLDKYNKQQFKNSPVITNDNYKQFIGYEQREMASECSDDSDSDQKHSKSGPKRRERKNYNKE